jgi:hypothetical protein
MRNRHPVLMTLFLISLTGSIFTASPIDSHGYWSLTHTSLEIQTISDSIASYAEENRRIPSNREVLTALENDRSAKHFVYFPRDHWGHPYVYKVLDANLFRFVVYSAGPDGADNGGAGDDVISGPKNYTCELYHSCLDAKDYANRAFVAAAAFIILTWIFLAVRSMFKWITRSRLANNLSDL